MSDTDANDNDKLKKALLTRYNYTEDGYRKRFREVKPVTEEMPDQFLVRLKNYLAKWLELLWKLFWRLRSPSGSYSQGTVYQHLF